MKSIKCPYCNNVYDKEFGVCPACGTEYQKKTLNETLFPSVAPLGMKLLSVVAVFILLFAVVMLAAGKLELPEYSRRTATDVETPATAVLPPEAPPADIADKETIIVKSEDTTADKSVPSTPSA